VFDRIIKNPVRIHQEPNELSPSSLEHLPEGREAFCSLPITMTLTAGRRHTLLLVPENHRNRVGYLRAAWCRAVERWPLIGMDMAVQQVGERAGWPLPFYHSLSTPSVLTTTPARILCPHHQSLQHHILLCFPGTVSSSPVSSPPFLTTSL
jgi:hypothetical protein